MWQKLENKSEITPVGLYECSPLVSDLDVCEISRTLTTRRSVQQLVTSITDLAYRGNPYCDELYLVLPIWCIFYF